MNQHLTEIAFILDRSGSMGSMVEPAISGFNRLLLEQQNTPGDARFTLVLFDDRYEVPHASVPISDVPQLDIHSYVPRGSTALLDAVARTIDELGERLAARPERERPGQVIVAILTDGLENASTRFTWQDVSQRIQHQTDCYQWQFLFLAANQDAIATAGRMSIHASHAAAFSMDAASYAGSKGAVSRKMSALRLHAVGDLSKQVCEDAEASLEDLCVEERKKGEK
jgi:hypothetical protein